MFTWKKFARRMRHPLVRRLPAFLATLAMLIIPTAATAGNRHYNGCCYDSGYCCNNNNYCNTGYCNSCYSYPYYEKVQFLAIEQDPYNITLAGDTLRKNARATAAMTEAQGLTTEVVGLRNEVTLLRQAISGTGVVVATPNGQVLPAADEPPSSTVSVNPPAAPIPQAPVPDVGNTPAIPMPPLTPPSSTVIPDGKDDLTKWVWSTLHTRCAECHSGANAKAKIQFFESDGVTHHQLTAGTLIIMDQALYSNEMPKAPVRKLDSAEYSRFRAWMQTYTGPIRRVARASDGQ